VGLTLNVGQSLVDCVLAWLWAKLRALWDIIARTGETVDDNSLKVVSTYEGIVTDTVNLINFLRDLREFDFDPKFQTRLISVPKAWDAFNELFDIIFHGIRDRFNELHVAVSALVASLKGRSPAGGHFHDPGGTLANVVDYIGDLDVAWKQFGIAYHDAVNLVELIDDVKRRLETLDDLFLPQGNPKKTVDAHYRKRQRS
jgi:hypothetical protein